MAAFLRTTVLALFLAAPAVAAFPPPAADKKFPKIAGWGEIIDPDGDCKITEDKGVLTVVVPKTHHDLTYQEDGTKRNAPRVLQPVEGDFTFKVTVKGTATPKNVTSSSGKYTYVSSGVVIWLDEKNFARMERGAICHTQDSAPYTHVELFTDGKSVRGNRVELGETDTGMRVTRNGKNFKLEVDPGNEGKKWTTAFDGEYIVPANLKIGVLALNTTAVEYAPQFAGVELKEKK